MLLSRCFRCVSVGFFTGRNERNKPKPSEDHLVCLNVVDIAKETQFISSSKSVFRSVKAHGGERARDWDRKRDGGM